MRERTMEWDFQKCGHGVSIDADCMACDKLLSWPTIDPAWLDERCSTFIRMECQELPDEVRGAVKTYLGVFCDFLKVRPATGPLPLIRASTTA